MNTTPLSLLERLRQQPDEPSWERLFGIYHPLVLRWLAQQSVSKPDAEDLAQEVCTTVVREIQNFQHTGSPGSFRGWVRAITVNRLRAYWRGRRSSPDHAGDQILDALADPDSDLSRQWDHEHDLEVLRRLLALVEPEFSPSTWYAFRRTVLDAHPAAHVAAELGVSVNAILISKSRVMRCLRRESEGLVDIPGDP